jgi:hypothetical protein
VKPFEGASPEALEAGRLAVKLVALALELHGEAIVTLAALRIALHKGESECTRMGQPWIAEHGEALAKDFIDNDTAPPPLVAVPNCKGGAS